MQFNSYLFIMVFFPVFVIGYLMFQRLHVLAGRIFLILMSLAFYAYGGLPETMILLASAVVNYGLTVLLGQTRRRRKPVLALLVAVNVLLLLYFKYYNFLLRIVNALTSGNLSMKELILPLGISFITFQQIMYALAVYRGEITELSLVDYLAYLLYFPKLAMGPMVEPAVLIGELHEEKNRYVNLENVANGLKLFGLGLFKKLVLADTFAAAVTWGFGNLETATSVDVLLVMLSYTFQIYFDFSGYSDMATGISEMINLRLPMNFNSPYKAISIRDFWKRWHMTLTGFLTKNLYIPLGGNRKGTLRMYLNTMIVFLVSGLWHGANVTFVLWGALHGALSIGDRIFDRAEKHILKPVRWLVTFVEVNVLWLLFRAESISQWAGMLKKGFSFRTPGISKGFLENFLLPEGKVLFKLLLPESMNAAFPAIGMVLLFLAALVICLFPENNYKNLKKNSGFYMAAAALAFCWAFFCLSNESVFVYFNF